MIKIGDLVETCSLLPGIVMSIDSDGDDIEVRMLTVDDYHGQQYDTCSIRGCGVRKINATLAKMMIVIGPDRLGQLYKSIDVGGKFDYNKYDHLILNEYELIFGENQK